MSSVAAAGDSRVVLRNVTWETYEALLEARAEQLDETSLLRAFRDWVRSRHPEG